MIQFHHHDDDNCCGKHDFCETGRTRKPAVPAIDYYDDEELDAYSGTAPDEYSETAVEEFREVLYTMFESDVAGWLRSLHLRNINLPDQLRDEALLMASTDNAL